MGLLGMSAGMLAASGPSRMPVSITQAIGQGMAGGLQGYGQGIQLQRQQQQMGLLEQQIAIAKLKAQKEAEAQEIDNNLMRQLFPGLKSGGMGSSPQGSGAIAQMPGGAPSPMSAARMPVQQGPIGMPLPESSDGEMTGRPQPGGMPEQAAPMPPQQMAPASGGFIRNLTPEQALLLNNRPMFKGAMDAWKFQKEGIRRQAGDTYEDPSSGVQTYIPKVGEGMRLNPDGSVSPVPGYIGTNSAIKGAETSATEDAKAGRDTTTYIMPDGTKAQMTRLQATDLMQRGIPLKTELSPGAQTRQAEGAKAEYQFEDVWDPNTRQFTRQKKSDVLSAGSGPGQNNFGGPGGAAISKPGPGAEEGEKEVGKVTAAAYNDIQNAGLKAPGNISKYRQLGDLLEKHQGGKLASTNKDLLSIGQSLGWLTADQTKRLGNQEAAQTIINQMALKARGGDMPGPLSNDDRKYLAEMVPRLETSKEGNKKILDMWIASEKRNTEVAKVASAWRREYGDISQPDKNGKTFSEAMNNWMLANPLFAPKGE